MLNIKKIFSFATLTLLVALALSSIAAWYSVLGLTAIFSAAVVPIMIMGGSLEFAKVVTTVWLHKYWNRAGWKLKLYLVPAVIVLAFLTSMGIFGFLSKAHSDQSLVSGDVQAKIAIYDQKIQIAKDNIDADRKTLQQMDSAVDQVMGRSSDVRGAQQSVNIRKTQAAERDRLNQEIASGQTTIAKLNEDASPIRAEVRKVEAEVGPIKYIAALIYGDNPDNNLLERAVRWVIIVIVLVFDPLALTLVLAAQSSYKWLEEDLKEEEKKKPTDNSHCAEKGDMYCVHDHPCAVTEILDGAPEEDDVSKEQLDENTDVVIDDPVEHKLQEYIPEQVISNVREMVVGDINFAPEPHFPEEKSHIETEGVTIHEMEHGYAEHEGKQVSKTAFLSQHPHIFATSSDNEKNGSNFGTAFPAFAAKGDVFVRVDNLPNRVYKFDGNRWLEINKDISDSYLYDEEYLRHLVTKLESGEYDVELLSENERSQIEDYLQRISNTSN